MGNQIKRPNILLIMSDQTRADAIGCYGNREIRTPNIDKLALNGSTFDNHFIQNPVCSPSRCSILTGRYPKNHGTSDNGIPLRDSETTLAEVLGENGYATAAIGKMHLTPMLIKKEDEDDDWPEDKYGFQVRHLTCDNKTGEYLHWLKEEDTENYRIVKEQGEKKLREDTASAADKDACGLPQVYESLLHPKYHQSTWIADKTIEFINDCDDKPFFAICSFVDPHHPFDPPKPYADMYDPEKLSPPVKCDGEMADKPRHFMRHSIGRGCSNEKYDYRKLSDTDWCTIKAKYYGMITLIDDNIGRIMNALEQKGIVDDTIVIYTSDHGELLGDHGVLFKGPFHYDCLIKAPFIIQGPNRIPRGSRYAEISEHVDIMPTLLEYAGIPVPYGVQGKSLASIMRGDRGSGRQFALTEFNCGDWGLNLKTLTSKEYKLTYYCGQQFGELYDRLKDPDEFKNLWDDPEYAQVKQMLIKKLLDRVVETEDVLPLRIRKF